MTQEEHFKSLELTLGYSFKDVNILKKSLVHKSYAHEKSELSLKHNERLELLGDAVLDLVITDLLLKKFPNKTEGELSRLRASVVNETMLARLATILKLGNAVFLGKGEERTQGRTKNSILANTYEAILAALYWDGGFDVVYRIIERHFKILLERAATEDIDQDFKTKLQEAVQGRHKAVPRYSVTKESGPDHQKHFEVSVSLNGEILAYGTGKNKKTAQQQAAQNALKIIKEESL